jgi:hypothetical protein
MLGHVVIVHKQSIVEFLQFFRFGVTGKATVLRYLSITLNYVHMTAKAGDSSFYGFGMIEFDSQILNRR